MKCTAFHFLVWFPIMIFLQNFKMRLFTNTTIYMMVWYGDYTTMVHITNVSYEDITWHQFGYTPLGLYTSHDLHPREVDRHMYCDYEFIIRGLRWQPLLPANFIEMAKKLWLSTSIKWTHLKFTKRDSTIHFKLYHIVIYFYSMLKNKQENWFITVSMIASPKFIDIWNISRISIGTLSMLTLQELS